MSQNRFEPVFVLKNQIELNRNQSGFFKKQISVWLLFFDKNRIEPKMITPTKRPTNISNFGIGKYRTNPKNTILLTLASVNIFAKDEFEEEIFYVIFSCLSFIIICPF